MELHNVLWIEDDTFIVDGFVKNFSEDKADRGYNIMPTHFTSLQALIDDPDLEISTITMALVCVDYNLPGGINGNDVIAEIRSYEANKTVDIIFYSSQKNESELQDILMNTITDISNIYFAHQDDLEDRIILLIG